jgi:hypothetical protein
MQGDGAQGDGATTETIMADNRSNRSPADRSIDIYDPQEVLFWCAELGVTPHILRHVVNKVGAMVYDVKEEIAAP